MTDLKQLKAVAAGMTLLVVDDDDGIRQMLQTLLENFFARVQVAANGREALALYRDGPPGAIDLLLTDIQMPEMDGLALARAIREDDHDLKILVVSAHNEAPFFLSALEIGVDAFIVKPVQTAQLFATLFKVCQTIHHRKARERYQADLAEEHRIASALVARLMRHEELVDPAVAWRLRTAPEVAGDWLAVYRNAHDQLLVMLADTTGYGLPAAINLSMLHRVFYSMARKGFALPWIVAELNRVVHEVSTVDRFVTATLLLFDPSDRVLELWNGGSPTAWLLDRNGREERGFSSRNLPLGVVREGFTARPERHLCSEGAQLFLCSDGLLGANSPTGEPLGEARWRSVLAEQGVAQPGVDHLLAAVDRHLDGNDAADDVVLLRLSC